MNLILMQAGFPPVIIRVEDRLKYYETLKEANDGDLRPFIRFIAQCTSKSILIVSVFPPHVIIFKRKAQIFYKFTAS